MSTSARDDRAELSRKAIHFGTAIWPVAWELQWLSTTQLRWILGALAAVALLTELLRRQLAGAQAKFIAWFGSMLRPHESRGITGATWGALSMFAVAMLLPINSAQVALWALVVGDGLAALAGMAWKRATNITSADKTIAGSVAALAGTAAGAIWLANASPVSAIIVGAATALAEFPRGPLDDNVRVTFAAGLAAWAVGLG